MISCVSLVGPKFTISVSVTKNLNAVHEELIRRTDNGVPNEEGQ